MTAPVRSLRYWLDDGAARLRGAGRDHPRDDALRIAAAVLKRSAGDIRMRDADLAPDAFADEFLGRIARRALDEPLAYVCGETGFRHLRLNCDARALIPRPETELLIDLALERSAHGTAADIGTGTGCLALSLALEGRFDRVVAVDRSRSALALAAENCRLIRPSVPVQLAYGDFVTMLRPGALQLLVSNPPYLTDAEWDVLDPSVKAWEPRLALPAGADGLAATRALLDEGRRVLAPGGWVALELDCRRADASAVIAKDFGWTDVAVHHDLFGRERFLLARRCSS